MQCLMTTLHAVPCRRAFIVELCVHTRCAGPICVALCVHTCCAQTISCGRLNFAGVVTLMSEELLTDRMPLVCQLLLADAVQQRTAAAV